MEVDELSGSAGDPENQLVSMFSSMATEDKDNLVKALQAIVGAGVSTASCRFFLELANWNLSAAIGAYYDFDFSQQQQQQLHLRQQSSAPDASAPRLAILSCEVASFSDEAVAVACIVYNECTLDCPPGCSLVCTPDDAGVAGDDSGALCEPCQLPSLRPGGNCTCRLLLPRPQLPPDPLAAAAATAVAASPRQRLCLGAGSRVRLRLYAPDGSPLPAPASVRCLDLALSSGAVSDAGDQLADEVADAAAAAAAASWARNEPPFTENPPPSPCHNEEQMME